MKFNVRCSTTRIDETGEMKEKDSRRTAVTIDSPIVGFNIIIFWGFDPSFEF